MKMTTRFKHRAHSYSNTQLQEYQNYYTFRFQVFAYKRLIYYQRTSTIKNLICQIYSIVIILIVQQREKAVARCPAIETIFNCSLCVFRRTQKLRTEARYQQLQLSIGGMQQQHLVEDRGERRSLRENTRQAVIPRTKLGLHEYSRNVKIRYIKQRLVTDDRNYRCSRNALVCRNFVIWSPTLSG